jgi:tRNA-Thr(GGU) m(6)t(6)A37 methyltransferase TsaA
LTENDAALSARAAADAVKARHGKSIRLRQLMILPLDLKDNMIIEAVGIIHTPYKTKEECPIQPCYAIDSPGRVEVFEEYERGLKDIEGFSHIYLLYAFDRMGKIELVRATFLDDEPHGIYASRHPCRPNGIGLSVVRLVRRAGNVLMIAGADMLDKTPLLDIKPYIPAFDAVSSASGGWTAGKKWRPKPEGRE